MKAPGLLFSGPLPCGLRASDCGSPSGCPRPRCCAPFLAARSPAYGGQALRYACAWLRASWHSAISGASRPSASLGCGLRVCGTACAVSSTLGAAHPFSGPLHTFSALRASMLLSKSGWNQNRSAIYEIGMESSAGRCGNAGNDPGGGRNPPAAMALGAALGGAAAPYGKERRDRVPPGDRLCRASG